MKARLDPLVPTSMAQEAFEVLRRSIIEGAFPPGERLVESKLAEELGISRAPVREALKRLEQDGLVVSQQHRGQFVADVTTRDIPHLYEVREALGVLAIAGVIRRTSERVAAELDDLVAEIGDAAAAGDLPRVVDREVRFHEVLCERSGNPFLARAFHAISSHVRMALLLDDAGYADLADIAQELHPLIAYIRQQDVAAATDYFRTHLWRSVRHLLDDAPPRT